MNTDQNHSFIRRCVSDTLEGLSDGLSHFSGSSRAAVIYCVTPESPLFICDPQNLLQGHEPRVHALYVKDNSWRDKQSLDVDKSKFIHIYPEENRQLAGLISYGGYSGSVFYQRWFTEQHPDLCCTGPTERWLEHAVWRFSHDIANYQELYTGISGSFLREYAAHAVRDHIVDEMNFQLGPDSQIRIYPVLDAVLGISKTREEGQWPYGELVIIEPRFLETMDFLVRFQEMDQPYLGNFKHTRKLLLTVEQSVYKLVSDGKSILGISSEKLPRFSISADFRGRLGFVKINGSKICSFSNGRFRSTNYQAKLVQLEETFIESRLPFSIRNFLFKIVAELVHNAQKQKYGCTLIIDLNNVPVTISGQTLRRPLDLRKQHLLELTKSLAKVDGALHIGIDLHLHGFACLLDGRSILGEDRARGARYNSALRFTAEHDNIIAVVVSADRPVSVIQDGVEISGVCKWRPVDSCLFESELLESWVEKPA